MVLSIYSKGNNKNVSLASSTQKADEAVQIGFFSVSGMKRE